MIRTMLIAAALGFAPLAASADETVIRHDDTAAPAASVTVKEHATTSTTDCSQQTVHKENAEGDSKTTTRTNC